MDLDFIKSKLDTLQGKNKQSTKFWKPVEGESKVRILPYKHNLENPFIELKFYYYRQKNGTTKTFLSPVINGNPDPVLEFCEKLRATGTKENWVLSKSYEPKLRTYVPVIVRGKEDEGVKFWGFGKQVYEAILEKMSNPDIGDITDIQNVHDLIIKFTKTPSSGKKFPETKVDVRIKKTPAVDPANDALLAKIQDQVDVMTLFTEPTYAELKTEFENHLNPENDPVPDAEATASEANDVTGDNTPDDTTAPATEDATTPATVARVATPESVPADTTSPSAATAAVNLSPDEMKAKFKKMFAAAASGK
jgi:hypothetical protein